MNDNLTTNASNFQHRTQRPDKFGKIFGIEPPVHKIGNRYLGYGSEYLLAKIPTDPTDHAGNDILVALVNVNSGNCWSEAKRISLGNNYFGLHEITQEDFKLVCNNNENEFELKEEA